MRFRLLGPLEIEVDGRLVEFSGLRQRRLLGALLLEVGRVVSEERLAEIVWYGDALPESAIPTMRTYVSRIRQSLRSSEVIVNRDGGYAAVLDGHTTDVQDFEGLVRRAEAASNSAGLIDLFTDSLALWRGALLGELSEEAWVLPQLGRLDEIRASAVEARAQAQLDLGLNGDVLVGLGPYLGEWSRRESIRGLHMTALYRSGREADALESFQEHRRLLAEDTGLEPGKELVELERRILGHDPSLDRVASGRPLRGYTLG
ncbi:MAG: SARP family transcriptional regulator, partial [Actinomycetia bacterium]|nr:SARP family transcriptional regulator [Actinomycetes bacterium]